jgi:hypothetical protein
MGFLEFWCHYVLACEPGVVWPGVGFGDAQAALFKGKYNESGNSEVQSANCVRLLNGELTNCKLYMRTDRPEDFDSEGLALRSRSFPLAGAVSRPLRPFEW